MKNSSYLSWAAGPLLAQLAKPAWPARAPVPHLRMPAVESCRRVAAMRRRRRHALTVLSARACPRSLTPPFPPFLRLVLARTASAAPARAAAPPPHAPRRSWLTRPPQLAVDRSVSPKAPPPPRAPRARLGKPWGAPLPRQSLIGVSSSSPECCAPWASPLRLTSLPLSARTSTALTR